MLQAQSQFRVHMASKRLWLAKAMVLMMVVGLAGCSTMRAPSPRDPLEPINRSMFQFNEVLDRYALQPVARGYQEYVPSEVRHCLGNFFSNLGDVAVAVNNALQGKFAKAGSDICRVALNSTLGIFGVADVATTLGFEKNDEDFGQTLGAWGLSSGPYLVLPVLGPSTVRDGTGRVVDGPLDPLRQLDDVSLRNSLTATSLVDKRATLLPATDIADKIALDKYAFIRDAYLTRRDNLVRDGAPTPTDYEVIEDDEVDSQQNQPQPEPATEPAAQTSPDAQPPQASDVPGPTSALPTIVVAQSAAQNAAQTEYVHHPAKLHGSTAGTVVIVDRSLHNAGHAQANLSSTAGQQPFQATSPTVVPSSLSANAHPVRHWSKKANPNSSEPKRTE